MNDHACGVGDDTAWQNTIFICLGGHKNKK